MELGGVPQKIDDYFHWGPKFYVSNSSLGSSKQGHSRFPAGQKSGYSGKNNR